MTEASAVLRDQCIGRQECFPDFNKGLNGYDPCPNYVKWMDARWDCEVPVVPGLLDGQQSCIFFTPLYDYIY